MALVRDIAIILIAIEALVVGIFLVILIWEIRNLTKLLRQEFGGILQSTSATVRTARTTTNFVSENVVEPVAKFSGFVAGVTAAARVLTRRDRT